MSIIVKNLNYTYNPDTPYETHALREITLTIDTGKFVGICGRTGSGKTTFVHHLNGLVAVQSGELQVEGLDLTVTNKKQRRETLKNLRSQVGMIFQYPEHQLFANTVYDDVAFGPTNMGLDKEEIDRRVRDSIKAVGLDFDSVCRHSPFELSGGEKRRVAFAGVLAMRPKILVLDEPTAGLDPVGKEEILTLLRRLNRQEGMTIVMISHDMDEVYEYTDRTIIFDNGRVAHDAPTMEIFRRTDVSKYGLQMPQMAILNNILEKNGIKLSTTPRTVEEMAQELDRYARKGGRANA